MQRRLLNRFILYFFVLFVSLAAESKRSGKLLTIRGRAALRRMGATREDLKPKICYDLVGCFTDPPPRLTLKRPPEHPNVIQTRFFLYTREKRDSPETLQYGDDLQSILKSQFDATKLLKVLIHGYKGSGSDVGSVLLMKALLDLEDVNVLVLDWTRGAAATYAAAVANTELVGRQLGLVISDMINLGTAPENVHIIGFSLGAHVAGCASEILKKRNLLLGRITGLDPASPFFRHHLFREKSRKLDATDAKLVDVIHTDGSPDFSEGFGLLKPLGHVDFFPNGGREQPGCSDLKNSVVVSHLKEDMLTKETACSHLRAWLLFLESVRPNNESCRFTAWPCTQRGATISNGMCFPMESTLWSQEMGYRANRGPLGIYYLATRGEKPFCGQPMRASVSTSKDIPKSSGILTLEYSTQNSSIIFKIRCILQSRRNKGTRFYNIATAKFDPLSDDLLTINATVRYETLFDETTEHSTRSSYSNILLFDKLTVEDRKGNRWEYCSQNSAIGPQAKVIELQRGKCISP